MTAVKSQHCQPARLGQRLPTQVLSTKRIALQPLGEAGEDHRSPRAADRQGADVRDQAVAPDQLAFHIEARRQAIIRAGQDVWGGGYKR